MNKGAILCALASAALFGVSTPAAKVLVGSIHPIILAGLLYCGAGIGVAVLRRVVWNLAAAPGVRRARLRRPEYCWLALAIFVGGVIGPLLLMIGLVRTDAATVSLLLTLEGAATALIAWFVFHESFDRRIAVGMSCIITGAAVLSWSETPSFEGILGPLAVLGACVAWGIDNNLTRKVSLADPLQIVELKGLTAGPVNLAIGLWAGAHLPGLPEIAGAATVGFLGYGLSLALFVISLRHLGAARTGAYFSTAPFLGAVTAIFVLKEPMSFGLLTAGALMAIGVWLHVTEHHEHEHIHGPVTHAHPHVHDEHHQHTHHAEDPAGEPHIHVHEHAELRHTHPHAPDMHHLHRH